MVPTIEEEATGGARAGKELQADRPRQEVARAGQFEELSEQQQQQQQHQPEPRSSDLTGKRVKIGAREVGQETSRRVSGSSVSFAPKPEQIDERPSEAISASKRTDSSHNLTNNNFLHGNHLPSPIKCLGQAQSPSKNSSYISSLVNKSSFLLSSLKQSYSHLTTNTGTHQTSTMQQSQSQPSPRARPTQERNTPTRASAPEQVEQVGTVSAWLDSSSQRQPREKVKSGSVSVSTTNTATSSWNSSFVRDETNLHRTGSARESGNSSPMRRHRSPVKIPEQKQQQQPQNKPPKPPPPSREVLQAALSAGNSLASRLSSEISESTTATGGNNNQQQHQLSSQQSGLVESSNNATTGTSTNSPATLSSITQPLGFGSGSAISTSTSTATAAATSTFGTAGNSTTGGLGRRHALQEQSLERDAALSLKARELKHKRTSSIKSALRHAHLGPLRSFNLDKRTGSSSHSSSSHSKHKGDEFDSEMVKSMPYELFEPPVTQRTFQRTKRRDAMMSDPRRQMSADTIGLRQLTDEYLHNAGVKPMSTSGQCSLVALEASSGPGLGASKGVPAQTGPTTSSTGVSSSGHHHHLPKRMPTVGTYSSSLMASLANQPQLSIETQLYQAGRHILTGSSRKSSGATTCSEDSLSNVTILPGNLPWQSDVSIQCEILQAPPSVEPYETTGDILNTIAGPFRAPVSSSSALTHAHNSTSCNSGPGSFDSERGANQLSATLKRGLTAISQHHLSPGSGPSAALNVVGSLKKSLSNTLDISHHNTGSNHLHSQDSLPAYSSLLNEPDSENEENSYRTGSNSNSNGTTNNANLDPESGGFINQLTSKLTRQGSKKFSVSKKGLQRALSFDCRGYKRLEHNHPQHQSNESTSSVSARNLLSAANKRQHHNKSTLALNVDLAPRPYLPQSASQVDFQVPLLPFHKMQEAIVAQRLLEPPAPAPSPSSSPAATKKAPEPDEWAQSSSSSGPFSQPDADQLLCAQTTLPDGDESIVEPQRICLLPEQQENSSGGKQTDAKENETQQAKGGRQVSRPPRLVLDIPTIATPHNEENQNNAIRVKVARLEPEEDEDGEEANAHDGQEEANRSTLVVCLPSPNISLNPSFDALSNSPSFCIDQNNKSPADLNSQNQLTASDVFSRSKIKRPSTMVVSDAMNEVAQALNSKSSAPSNKHQQQQEGVSTVLRNRRQAIVPPKLATDGSNSDGENKEPAGARVGKLVDVEDESDKKSQFERSKLNLEDEAALRAFRRKRSGGGAVEKSANSQEPNKTQEKRLSCQTNLPTFYIEPSADQQQQRQQQEANEANSSSVRQTPDIGPRPDSQMTNVDSLVSSGSSTNLSINGKNRDFTVTSPGGLTVSFGSSRGRRRSSIAVIPQMQICPGDLLVYSKQLIDRMNQSEETEPPQFLTIDDKKGKNIWSSFKLCAQFDNRTLKARNELLCSLEDVLASLQPSTFIDEQLSHYKGMLWNEFLYETESRRSASSDGLALLNATLHNANLHEDNQEDDHFKQVLSLDQPCSILRNNNLDTVNSGANREPLKVTLSSSGANFPSSSTNATKSGLPINESNEPALISGPTNSTAAQQPLGGHRSRDQTARSISSRFREKPKLKRGQTVDSVFRIPLIPSSPLKHAQQHQQTPTAHLEQDDLITIEDDERSSPSASSRSPSREFSLTRRSRSASTRSRSGSSNRAGLAGATNGNNLSAGDKHGPIKISPSAPSASTSPTNKSKVNKLDQNEKNGSTQINKDQDSSFETDDAMDLIGERPHNQHTQLGQVNSYQPSSGITRTPHQIMRQSSLSTLSSTITRTEQKRQRALWDLFQSECTFFFDHLMTLKNVYMEPLKKIQVEGFAMFADPDVLFGNLDELCCGVYDFCKEFLYIIMRTLKTRPEELNATDVLIKLYKKNPKIDHLRGVYHRYTLNYINALTYLESLRRQVEFVEFEKWSSRDVRCKKLQLTDLLVAPVQHIMRVPIILKDIESHTENPRDREEIIAILAVEEASLRELDDKMRWLKNFERLLEIQKNISWPSVLELDSKLFVPEFLKDVLSKQPCEKLIVSPRRQIVHEGTLSNVDLGRACDMHVILFDDMLLLTRRKKGLTKKASTVCKTNSGGGSSTKDDGSYKYIVYKQPLSLDRFYVHDVQQVDAQAIGMKYLFLLIVMNRFQQIINVHSFSASNDDVKQTWLFKIKKTADRWKKNLSSGSGEQHQEQAHIQPLLGQHNSTLTPTSQEPTSGHHSSPHQSRVSKSVPKVNEPGQTCSD